MKNNSAVVGLLCLLIGLFVGYSLAPRVAMGPESMVEMHNEMEEMMDHEDDRMESGFMQHSMEEMNRGLKGKTGEAFEKAFLEMMIVHHEGAIEMAEDLLNETNRPELVKMANDIITVQTAEIEMMEEWLTTWFIS